MRNNQTARQEPIILLVDGECLLCRGVTRFVIRRDPAGRFRFAALQSPLGQQLLERAGLPTGDLDTFVMIDRGVSYTRSTAALRTLRELGGLWRLCWVGMLVPERLRDAVYRWIAGSRYRWFGRSAVCALPDAEQRGRVLEGGESR